MKLLIDCQYFAPAIFYKNAIEKSHVVFDIYEHGRKMSYRNRCAIAGAEGTVLLSVPLDGGRDQRKPMKEVKIKNMQKWQSQHWKTICSCYNRSPWFEHYQDGLENLYSKKYEYIMEWNMATFQWACKALGVNIGIEFTSEYLPDYEKSVYEDWRNKLLPATILQEFPDPVKYYQVFEERTGFIPHLSILDLLFCEGKNAAAILRK
ncbi:MAG: WbqC family protein [Chitinophagaceae bacterium]